MAIVDEEWRPNMDIEQAMVLMCKCIGALEKYVSTDIGGVVIKSITKDGIGEVDYEGAGAA
jgi:20S proteasome alpha/beta subunit